MKSFIAPVIVLGLCTACSSIDFPSDEELHRPSVTLKGIRSPREVEIIATKASKTFSEDQNTKAIDERKVKSIIRNDLVTKSSSKEILYYIVNFADEAGYCLVGADVSSPEILAYINSGSYYGGKTDNPGFNLFIDEIENNLEIGYNLSTSGLDPIILLEDETSTTTSTTSPLIHVAWHQDYPFNMYCSLPYNQDIPTGCVAVAVAQTMSVFSWPSTISLTFPNAIYTLTPLFWDQMNQGTHEENHALYCNICTQEGLLLREIGERVEMDYSVNGSFAWSSDVPDVYNSFGYTCSSYGNYSLDATLSSLSMGYPVYIRAERANDDSGHAWVVDGSKYTDKTTTTYEVYPDGHRVVGMIEHDEIWYLHFNYGYGPTYNGYYIAYRTVSSNDQYPLGGPYSNVLVNIFTGPHNFNQTVMMITNIHPNQ